MRTVELRIGNKLFDYNNRIITISLIDYPIQLKKYFVGCKENHSRYTINDIKPIPLTEQWLKDFGFDQLCTKRADEQFDNYEIYNKEDFQIDKAQEEQDEKGYWFFINGYSINIVYVHQLQNLYFALTGKELIK